MGLYLTDKIKVFVCHWDATLLIIYSIGMMVRNWVCRDGFTEFYGGSDLHFFELSTFSAVIKIMENKRAW